MIAGTRSVIFPEPNRAAIDEIPPDGGIGVPL